MTTIERRSCTESPIRGGEIEDVRAAGMAAEAYRDQLFSRSLAGRHVTHHEALRTAVVVGLVLRMGDHGLIESEALQHAVDVAAHAFDAHDPRKTFLVALQAYRWKARRRAEGAA